MKSVLIINIALLLAFVSLAQQRFNKQNFAEVYNTNAVLLHPEFQIYNSNDTISRLFYQLDNSELKYNMNSDSVFIANAKIHYSVYYNYKAKVLVDSGSYIYSDNQNYGKNISSFGYIDISIKASYNYLILVEYTDINRDYSVKKLIEVDKTNKYGFQNFYMEAEDNLPILKNYLNKEESFYLLSRIKNDTALNIRFFKPSTTIPKPPMVEETGNKKGMRADTLYKITLANGKSNLLQLNDQGFYHFYFNDSKNKGFTVFRFTNNYPYITSPMQMIMPLRYITSSKEFNEMYRAKNKKAAVEKFWIKISGDEESYKDMMSLYYNRVQNANINFTADREGWATDRGMIYIVYGAPDIVYSDKNMETWKYGDMKNANRAITFNFYKVKNPFSDNYYVMERNSEYKNSWIKFIRVWRK